MTKLILDIDGRTDVAAALMLWFEAGCTPKVITWVLGNVGLAAATRNTFTTLSRVVAVSAAPIS